jgi:hypothetical protein
MKKIVIIILTAMMALTVGCSPEKTASTDNTAVSNTSMKPTQGIAYNKIKFETVNKADWPIAVSSKIEKLKDKKGFAFTEDKDSGYIYIMLFAGEKPTGGYSLEVFSIGDSEGKTEVIVEEKAPSKDAITTQQITYPVTVVKVKGITTNISVTNRENTSYKNLDK